MPQPLTSLTVDLKSLNYGKANWYEDIPDRTKLRIVSDLLKGQPGAGGIYAKVWTHFRSSSQPVYKALQTEKSRLKVLCSMLTTQISPSIRKQANQIIKHFDPRLPQATLPEITAFIEQEFDCKENLLQRLKEQALAEGIQIEAWDLEWARHHCLEDTHRFVQALSSWLDIY